MHEKLCRWNKNVSMNSLWTYEYENKLQVWNDCTTSLKATHILAVAHGIMLIQIIYL